MSCDNGNHGAVQAIIDIGNDMEDNLKIRLCNELIRQGKVKEGDVIRHSYTSSRFDSFHIENKDNHDCCSTIPTRANTPGVVEEKSCSPTLDTRCDCLGVCVEDMKQIINDKNGNNFTIEDTKQLRETIENNELYNGSSLDLYNRTTHSDGIMQTLDTGYHNSQRVCVDDGEDTMIENKMSDNVNKKQNLRIRKLTPRECFRLQGVKDEDFDKIAQNQSNASLYHLAGDSITTSVLMSIFGELLGVEYKNKMHKLEDNIAPSFDWESVASNQEFISKDNTEKEITNGNEIRYEQVSLLDLI